MAQNNQTKSIDNCMAPAANEAGRQYEENGGRLTLFSEFGQDPLAEQEDLVTAIGWRHLLNNRQTLKIFFTA